jgi:hypothetical protein
MDHKEYQMDIQFTKLAVCKIFHIHLTFQAQQTIRKLGFFGMQNTPSGNPELARPGRQASL